MNEPRWLSVETIIEFNRLAVAETGEPFAVRDQGLLESASERPRNHWLYGEADVATLAVKLLLGIAQNHPFEQGNKRAAFAAADAFMYLNGYEINASDHEQLADFIVQVITGEIREDELITAFVYSSTPTEG